MKDEFFNSTRQEISALLVYLDNNTIARLAGGGGSCGSGNGYRLCASSCARAASALLSRAFASDDRPAAAPVPSPAPLVHTAEHSIGYEYEYALVATKYVTQITIRAHFQPLCIS
jgi:hypothetical protein